MKTTQKPWKTTKNHWKKKLNESTKNKWKPWKTNHEDHSFNPHILTNCLPDKTTKTGHLAKMLSILFNVLNVLQTGGQSIFNTDIMQLLTNLFLLAHHLSLASGLRLIGNGLGLPAYGVEENVVDFSLLAADQKAALPSQVQPINHFWHFACFSVHHLLVGNFGCFDHRTSLLSTSSSVWESLDLTVHVPWKRGKHIQINGNVTFKFISEIRKLIWLKPFKQGCQRNIG